MTASRPLELPPRILVAVDGSAAAEAAVTVAARLAGERGTALDVVHIVEASLVPHRPENDPLPAAVAVAASAASGVDVRGLARTGAAASVLRDLARDYALVVLGSRGHGVVADVTLGSHAIALAGSLDVPFLVVRPGAERLRRRGPVVAALAGDGADDAVLEFAFAEAEQRSVALVAAHGWSRRSLGVRGLVLAAVAPAALVPADAVAAELAPWRRRHPEVSVHLEVRSGSGESAVLEAARGASLIVMASRGRGSRTGAVLGSVSQAVLHHAHCPVAIVPRNR